jgi:hypothetical protein
VLLQFLDLVLDEIVDRRLQRRLEKDHVGSKMLGEIAVGLIENHIDGVIAFDRVHALSPLSVVASSDQPQKPSIARFGCTVNALAAFC